MPRKKTIQPEPLDTFKLENGDIVEIRDETCHEIGRGLHKRVEYIKKRNPILDMVVEDYFDFPTKEGDLGVYKGRAKDDYLKSPTTFIRKLELIGLGGEDGASLDWNRRKLYPDIVQNVRAYRSALKEARYFLHPN